MASLNYQMKAPGSAFTNKDLASGYLSAVAAAMCASVGLRKLTQGMTRTATGSKLLILNTAVSSVASAIAAYFNTTCIR